ncbi:DUF4184 family protein [Paenibacillus gallinarum]|uniref:DUF4184 family protein n=1 Tax=Paenibacillus gallinarum TaxID=2762232 RepID=A0ABR8SY51_9BACL|nr:DUF4184 family protein [Paenibacillus gallinarum]MBD7968423.1 DUF4184 family protein [Paenibacillus gallinarum]
MPLTFAHPAAVLPFVRNKTYLHFPALVLGSMAPDFEYFLRGRPSGEIGHTINGFMTLNLFLVILTYLVYRYIVYPPLFSNLPSDVQGILTSPSKSEHLRKPRVIRVLVFVYSAWLGMATHVIWDSFTHQGGFMVLRWSLLQETLSISTYDLPVYKILQHGSTLFGLTIIFLFSLSRLWMHRNEVTISGYSLDFNSGKWRYWLSLGVLMIVIFVLWMVMDPLSLSEYGVLVVRVIDSVILGFLFISLAYLFWQPFSFRSRQ